MTELRAPDPTLMRLHPDPGVVTLQTIGPGRVAIAHAWDCGADCDPADTFSRFWADHAAYIAVPCRECFPDSPHPGTRHWTGADGLGAGATNDPHLAWQVR